MVRFSGSLLTLVTGMMCPLGFSGLSVLSGEGVQDGAQRRPELGRFAGVGVVWPTAHEAAMVAREGDGRRPQSIGDGMAGAGGDGVAGLLANRQHDVCVGRCDRVDVVPVASNGDAPLGKQRVV